MIDVMLTGSPENVKTHGVIDTPGISDHCLIFMAYSIKKPKFKAKMVTRRDFRKFNENKFIEDMSTAPWGNIYAVADDDLDNKVTIFENIHRDIIDRHAPMRTFRVTRPASPWLTDEIRTLMDQRDSYKNKFNVDKNPNSEILYKDLRNRVTHAIRESKVKAFNDHINFKINDSKQFNKALKNFSVVESKMANANESSLDPTILNKSFLKNNNAFVNETEIDNEIEVILKNSKPPTFSFVEVTEREVMEVVRRIKTHACGVDQISALFFKMGIEHSVYALTSILNCSFLYNKFPTRWKDALVKPIPKNNNPSQPSDYRPISLLPAFSKILEKLAAKQMIQYLKNTNSLDKLQSAYKPHHSTVTALLNVTDDIYDALEESELTFLVLLDYSKAFDCANHRLILAKLQAAGFRNESLSWLYSYLSNRRQKVINGSNESCWENIKNGVPQGSILGPLLFTVLVSDIGDVIKRGKYHLYADDTQLYYRCKVEDANATVDQINSDLKNVADYSKKNCLKLNTDKSNFIIIGSRQNLKKLQSTKLKDIMLNDQVIERKYDVKNLGIIFDESLTWSKQVNLSVAKAYGKLNHAYRFKKFLSESAKWRLCEVHILSQLNYGDVILQNITKTLSDKIQRVQNRCIRFSRGLRKYDHVSAVREKMGQLSMADKRLLHGLTLIFKISKNIAPAYLCDRLSFHRDIHDYNTRNKHAIRPKMAKTKTRSMSFFVSYSNKLNEAKDSFDFSELSINSFKNNCRQYLLKRQSL